MKRMAVLALSTLLVGCTAHAQNKANSDKDAVRAAAMDYIEALYQAQPDRIARSVHPKLTKLGFSKKQGASEYSESPMTYDQLFNLAGSWNKDGKRPVATAPKEVAVYEVLDQTASVKVTALWGIDYMHLAKYDGQWKIINILWQAHPPK
jgi:Putative lumazine-binding